MIHRNTYVNAPAHPRAHLRDAAPARPLLRRPDVGGRGLRRVGGLRAPRRDRRGLPRARRGARRPSPRTPRSAPSAATSPAATPSTTSPPTSPSACSRSCPEDPRQGQAAPGPGPARARQPRALPRAPRRARRPAAPAPPARALDGRHEEGRRGASCDTSTASATPRRTRSGPTARTSSSSPAHAAPRAGPRAAPARRRPPAHPLLPGAPARAGPQEDLLGARKLAAPAHLLPLPVPRGRPRAQPRPRAPLAPRRAADPVPPRRSEVAALLDVPGEATAAARGRAILELLYATGIRCAELVGWTWPTSTSDARMVRVLGKGRKERIVPFGDAGRETPSRPISRSAPGLGRGPTRCSSTLAGVD